MKSFSKFLCLLVYIILIGELSYVETFIEYDVSINQPRVSRVSRALVNSSTDIATSRPSCYTCNYRYIVTSEHNRHRRSRRVTPSPANMNTLDWDAKLAEMAQGWSEHCFYDHGKTENTSPFDYVGQNLYIHYSSEAGGLSDPSPAVAIQAWYDEAASYTYEDSSCTGVCSHFTQVVWAKTTHVGCGQTYCPRATDTDGNVYTNVWLIVCNYGPGGNYKARFPYLEGERCSKCDSPATCKSGLCKDCDLMKDDHCTCQLQCENCGFIDTTNGKCKCNCRNGFSGVNCEIPCENTHRYCGTSPGWPDKSYCGLHPAIARYCPLMCGICDKPDPDFICREV